MGKTKPTRKPIKVNLLPEAYDAWERKRGGYSRTVFATGSTVALMGLSAKKFHEIMELAGTYDDGRSDWQPILCWVERQQAEDADLAVEEAAEAKKRKVRRGKHRGTGEERK